MPLWNPEAKVPTFRNHSKNGAEMQPIPMPMPLRDAARMAALKRLRHRMTSLCSKHADEIVALNDSATSASRRPQRQNKFHGKPPVLAFERWLSRAALRRDEVNIHTETITSTSTSTADGSMTVVDASDPVIPSDGVVDEGLVKDLSRNFPHSVAHSIAEIMANEGKVAAERVAFDNADVTNTASKGDSDNTSLDALKIAGDCIKESIISVKLAAKLVQKSIDYKMQQSHPDLPPTGASEDINIESGAQNTTVKGTQGFDLESSLKTLRKATETLEACAKNGERVAGYASDVNISGSRRPGMYDVAIINSDGTLKKPYLTVSAVHLKKMVSLWRFRQMEEDKREKKKNGHDDLRKEQEYECKYEHDDKQDGIVQLEQLPDKVLFLRSLYCCLARYDGLKGAGYQCAVPGGAFDAAADQCGLGTTIECFASPLNCRYRRFCSAFPDVEARFGSLGSFFDNAFFPIKGSFESNPPFVPAIMFAMGDKIDRILSNPKAKALSFLVIVPAWGAGIQFCEQMEDSKFVRAKARVLASDHAYYDGAQHNRPSRSGSADLRPSSWDTAVILLQNDGGAKKWPVSAEKLESTFCAAFRDAAAEMPAESATIEKWERRGVARGGKSSSSWNQNKRSRTS
jgi:hypothetical protein